MKNTTTAEAFQLPRVAAIDPMEVHEELTGPNGYHNPHQYGSATDRQAQRIAAERFEDAKAHALPTAELLKADKELEALERKRAEIESKKQREVARTATFRGLIADRDALNARLKYADDEFANICAPGDQEAFIETLIGERNHHPASSAQGLLLRYQSLAAIREAQVHYPKWRAKFCEKIEAANKDILEFAETHKIAPPDEGPKPTYLGDLAPGEFFDHKGETYVLEDLDQTVPSSMRSVTSQNTSTRRHLSRDLEIKRVVNVGKRVFASN